MATVYFILECNLHGLKITFKHKTQLPLVEFSVHDYIHAHYSFFPINILNFDFNDSIFSNILKSKKLVSSENINLFPTRIVIHNFKKKGRNPILYLRPTSHNWHVTIKELSVQYLDQIPFETFY